MALTPVILCGGSSTRLWPGSRESMPMQSTRLVDAESLAFQATARRVTDASVFAKPIVIASSEARFIVAEQLLEAEIPADIVLEPSREASAAAGAVAALPAARRDPEAVVLILAADQVIGDALAFAAAARIAATGARDGHIMTLSIEHTRKASDYDYVRFGPALDGLASLHAVERFVQKPDSAGVERMIHESALWNLCYFLLRADIMLAELEAYLPDVLAAARGELDTATTDLDFVRLDAAAFARAPKTSIDYAVMGRTGRAGVLPVSFLWSDVGTWNAVWQVNDHDGQGNAVRGRVELVGISNSLIHSEGEGLTTVVGFDDVVVVAPSDAQPVASKLRFGEVKELVTALRKMVRPEADAHRRIYGPWRWHQRIDIGERFQVKRIMVTPGGRLSLQKHFHRAEHWVVVKGTAEVTPTEQIIPAHKNEAVYLPIASMHRLTNPGQIQFELIEVHVGSYTGEDDIITSIVFMEESR